MWLFLDLRLTVVRSNFGSETPPGLVHPRGAHDQAADYRQHTTKHPNIREIAGGKDGAGDWRADQHTNRDEREAHAHPRADDAPVGAEMHKDGRGQADKRAREKAVEETEYDDAADVVDGDEADRQDTADQPTRDYDVHWATLVGDEVGQDTAKDAGGVEDAE